jgi:hypothetical protein
MTKLQARLESWHWQSEQAIELKVFEFLFLFFLPVFIFESSLYLTEVSYRLLGQISIFPLDDGDLSNVQF